MKKDIKIKNKKIISLGGLISLCIFLVLSILVLVFKPEINNTFMYFDHENDFVKNVVQKIPALLDSVCIVTFCVLTYKLIRLFSHISFKNNGRMLTIMSLVTSLLKWVVIIAAILLVLGAFGVDTTTLLASAGILTLVIGLGAQSLVADIIAGFFLVIEGEYSVGDIISIDGWRGTVKDIGIRVTRLVDAGGNVKTINNSDVKNVVNQTNELSIAKVYMPIDYGESLERVELVLKNNFLEIANKIPDIVDGPYYKGVSELGESSVNLLIVAKCHENNIYQVQRDLTRELYIVFNKNNITIPFNQMVLSYREDDNNDVSKKDEKNADKFVKEQKELTKDIIEPEDK